MSPILGILASSTLVSTNSYSSIATVSVGSGGQATVDFTSIPSTYKHLQIRFMARSTRVDAYGYFRMRFNSDTGSNYSLHNLYGSGSSAAANAGVSLTSIEGTQVPGASAAANIFGVGVIDLLDYTNTNKYKTARFLYGDDRNNTQGYVFAKSGLWMSTSAITSITLSDEFNSFAEYSSLALYGIKG